VTATAGPFYYRISINSAIRSLCLQGKLPYTDFSVFKRENLKSSKRYKYQAVVPALGKSTPPVVYPIPVLPATFLLLTPD
jgi:hypothetical protein